MAATNRCVHCGREIRVEVVGGERQFVPHVNSKTNRSCAGSEKFAVYGMHSASAYANGGG